MAPDGQFSASATTFSTLAASGLIHSPGALGTKTCGLPSTQLREWMQRLLLKETSIFSPSTVPAMGDAPVGDEARAAVRGASSYKLSLLRLWEKERVSPYSARLISS